jgi:hypothetical protein
MTTYTQETLEATPERVTKLLSGIGALPTVRTLMADAGMTDADIDEGRALLMACLAAPKPKKNDDTADAAASRSATAELDQWDEPNFERVEAMLRRRHPSVCDYVFRDLKASTGAQAVKGVATFLSRLDAVEQHTDPERQDPVVIKDDDAAIALLAKRKLDAAERKRLAGLVQTALGPTSVLPTATVAQALADQRNKALVDLRAWYDEWASTAKTVVKKRGDLIRLGLATRKKPVKKTANPATPATPTTTPK